MSTVPDSITGLTSAQLEAFNRICADWKGEDALKRLKRDLQIAIEIELATIPVYLFAYYSIARTPREEVPWTQVSDAQLYANKAGAVIMSVVVEEMLHLSLSSNILYALTGEPPRLYGKSPEPFPTNLPHHKADLKIPLARLSYQQLWRFLQIEYPASAQSIPTDENWHTIGQFYAFIRYLIAHQGVTNEDFGKGGTKVQIQPYNYSPNNIDTIHPKGVFNPWGMPPRAGSASAAAAAEFENQPDSHSHATALQTVHSKQDALEAITTICDQGEGFSHEATDDSAKAEYSHYYKFLRLQAQLEAFKDRSEPLPAEPAPPSPIQPTITDADLKEITFDFPDNPTTRGYLPDMDAVAMSNLCNGVYQYMLILTETVFKVPDPKQKLFFNQGMHYSMIWVLDKLIQAMRAHTLTGGEWKEKQWAPTFENKLYHAKTGEYFDLGRRDDGYKTAHGNLIELTKATDGTKKWTNIVAKLPDVAHYWK